jgi:hypothetical protein
MTKYRITGVALKWVVWSPTLLRCLFGTGGRHSSIGLRVSMAALHYELEKHLPNWHCNTIKGTL